MERPSSDLERPAWGLTPIGHAPRGDWNRRVLSEHLAVDPPYHSHLVYQAARRGFESIE